MPVSVGELKTEVTTESDHQMADARPSTTDKPQNLAAIRAQLAALARRTLRTRAEGFDD
jgi:hypothetical protein